jgi:UDP-N-acetylmuramoylalanine--D-glutamate ligase
MEAAGKNVFVCGNIGNPFANEVSKMTESDYVSLEVSSFQLERIRRFKPNIAVMLNFTCNHLDRYRDMKEYLDVKKRIFLNQDKDDYLVINYLDPTLRDLAKEANSNIVYFSKSKDYNPNQAAAFTVGKILMIDEALMATVFKEFKGIEHRLEFVTEINNVKFVNDSKATTVDSTIWALKIIDKPIVLIAGGKDKGVDYNLVLNLAREKVKDVVLIGEAKKKIESVFKGFLPVDEADSLDEAVIKAYQKAKPGDCVLLSPMCSSFDMFSSFEERGNCFKKAVFALDK